MRRLFVVVAAAMLFASCQKFAEGRLVFRDLLALRDAIALEFHEKVVDVNIANGNQLTVKFRDSPLASRSREEKQKRADDVAKFVSAHYKGEIKSVTTMFVTQAGGLSVGERYVGRQ